MKLVLTDRGNGKELIVESDLIRLMEPDQDGTGTHIVFAQDAGRDVAESLPSIAAAIGVTVPKVVTATSAALTAKVAKAKKK